MLLNIVGSHSKISPPAFWLHFLTSQCSPGWYLAQARAAALQSATAKCSKHQQIGDKVCASPLPTGRALQHPDVRVEWQAARAQPARLTCDVRCAYHKQEGQSEAVSSHWDPVWYKSLQSSLHVKQTAGLGEASERRLVKALNARALSQLPPSADIGKRIGHHHSGRLCHSAWHKGLLCTSVHFMPGCSEGPPTSHSSKLHILHFPTTWATS